MKSEIGQLVNLNLSLENTESRRQRQREQVEERLESETLN